MSENPNRQVKLVWKGRDGETNPDFSVVMTHNASQTTDPVVPDSPGLASLWYDVPNVVVNATQSVSNFWFEIDEGSGSSEVKNQGGAGYILQDVVLLSTATCLNLTEGFQLSTQIAVSLSFYALPTQQEFDLYSTRFARTSTPAVYISRSMTLIPQVHQRFPLWRYLRPPSL